MLFDPNKWDKPIKTKVEPLSLAGLIAWLETQPPEQEYNWLDCGGHCLADQYGRAIGHSRISQDRDKQSKILAAD